MFWIKMWIESRGRLPTYLLVGGSGLNVVHACRIFFFYMSTRYAYLWSDGLKFGRASQRSDGLKFWTCFPEVRWFEVWTCFPEVRWNWIFGRASQRSNGLESWTCFPEVQGFEFWTCFPEVRWIEVLDVLPRGPMV